MPSSASSSCAAPREVVGVAQEIEQVVGEQQVGAPALAPQLPRDLAAEERLERRHARLARRRGRARRRVDAEDRHARRGERAQHAAVVAAGLDHERARTELPAPQQLVRARLVVRDQRRQDRGVVGVLGAAVERVRRHLEGQLQERAALAEGEVERVERLRPGRARRASAARRRAGCCRAPAPRPARRGRRSGRRSSAGRRLQAPACGR